MQNLLLQLIRDVYTKNDYIEKHFPRPEDIATILHSNDIEQLTISSVNSNKHALDEIKQHLNTQENRNFKSTLKSLKDKFRLKPYGWAEMDISGLAATLFVIKEIHLQYNQDYINISDGSLINYLTKIADAEKLIIGIKVQIKPLLIKNVKGIITKLFDITDLPDDEDKLFSQVKEILNKEINQLAEYKTKYDYKKYPGENIIKEVIDILNQIWEIRDCKELFDKLIKKENVLEELFKETNPIKGFFTTSQVNIFDKGLIKLEIFQDDLTYYPKEIKDKVDKLKKILKDSFPFSSIKDIPLIITIISKEHNRILKKKKTVALKSLELVEKNIKTYISESNLSIDYFATLLDGFKTLENQINKADGITTVVGIIGTIKEQETRAFEQVNKEIGIKTPKSKKIKPVIINKVIEWDKVIETEEELDLYIEKLKKELKDILHKGKKIKIV